MVALAEAEQKGLLCVVCFKPHNRPGKTGGGQSFARAAVTHL